LLEALKALHRGNHDGRGDGDEQEREVQAEVVHDDSSSQRSTLDVAECLLERVESRGREHQKRDEVRRRPPVGNQVDAKDERCTDKQREGWPDVVDLLQRVHADLETMAAIGPTPLSITSVSMRG